MIQTPMDVLQKHPVRKTKQQKVAFRTDVLHYLGEQGFSCTLERGGFQHVNVVAGDPVKAKILVTAHYDTCAAMPFPNFITPCNFSIYLMYQLLFSAVLLFPSVLICLLLLQVDMNASLRYFICLISLYSVLLLLLFGPANKSNANDNTSGVVTLLSIASTLPESYRDQVAFVLFDLEEAGLLGSAAYRKKHKKESQTQLVLNLDCVGDGDTLAIIPGKKVRRKVDLLSSLQKLSGEVGNKKVLVLDRGFQIYPSDQANFPLGVGICALKQKNGILYMDRIHTKKDVVLQQDNVNILRDKLVEYIGAAAQERK